MELKEAIYNVGGQPVKVAYLVREKEIYFSSLDRTASSINRVESIIRAICETEGISRRGNTFYDFQTGTGYTGHGSGYYCVDRLTIQEKRHHGFHVVNWSPVASSASQSRENLPPNVFEAFQHLII